MRCEGKTLGIADSRTTKANFSWQFAVAVLVIIASIAIYYVQKMNKGKPLEPMQQEAVKEIK